MQGGLVAFPSGVWWYSVLGFVVVGVLDLVCGSRKIPFDARFKLVLFLVSWQIRRNTRLPLGSGWNVFGSEQVSEAPAHKVLTNTTVWCKN